MDMKHTRSILRLICEINPPLPNEGKHWDMKDELVKWQKTGPKVEEVKSVRYWSDDMTKTAISFSNVTLDILGSYSCIYGDVLATINVLGEINVLCIICGKLLSLFQRPDFLWNEPTW